MSQEWQADLTAAFTVLLGRPPDAFDPAADYVLYYRNALATMEIFGLAGDALTRVVRPAAGGGRPEPLSVCLGPDWGLDLARSEFELDLADEPALQRAFDAVPDATFLDPHRTVLLGADLAAVLAGHGVSTADLLAALETDTIGAAVTLRVTTDGTLRDALLTATRTGAGPDGLRPGPDEAAALPFAAGVFGADEPSPPMAAERDRILAAVHDPRLRAHVWAPYLDMAGTRSADGTVAGARPEVRWTGVAARPTTRFVVAWDLAYYGEISLAVAQHGGQPPAAA